MHTILIVDIRGKKIVRQLCEKGGVDSILLLDSIYYITGKLISFYSNVIIYMYFFYNTKFLFFLFPIKSCSRFQRTLLIRYTLNGQFQSDLSCWWWNFFFARTLVFWGFFIMVILEDYVSFTTQFSEAICFHTFSLKHKSQKQTYSEKYKNQPLRSLFFSVLFSFPFSLLAHFHPIKK